MSNHKAAGQTRAAVRKQHDKAGAHKSPCPLSNVRAANFPDVACQVGI